MAKIKKYQTGGDVPKGMVRGEDNRFYDAKMMAKRDSTIADAMNRQAGLGKYAPKKNDAINNKPLKDNTSSAPKKPMMKSGGKVPTTPKEKKFAALAPPKNRITFADKLAGIKKRKK